LIEHFFCGDRAEVGRNRPVVGQEKRREYISTSGVKKPVLKISV